MRDFLRRLLKKRQSSPLQKEWVAIMLKLSGGEFGSRDEQDDVRLFAGQLRLAIAPIEGATFDGDEFGNHEAGLYLFGPNADQLYEAIEALLRSWPRLRGGHVVKRYGTPSRSERIEF